MDRYRIKIPTIGLFLFIVLFPFFKPSYAEEVEWLDLLFNLLRVAAAGVITFLHFINQNQRTVSNYILGAIVLLCLISTLNNNGSMIMFILRWVFPLVVFIIVSDYIREIGLICKFVNIIAFIYLIINQVTIIVFEHGMYQRLYIGSSDCWFLGQKNEFFYYFFIFSVMSIIGLQYGNSIRSAIVINVLIFLNFLSTPSKSINGLISIGLFIILVLAYKALRQFVNGASVGVISAILWVSIIITQTRWSFLSYAIDSLNKDFTFSGRTRIWSSVLEVVKSNFWIGVGSQTTENTRSMLNVYYGLNAHDTILHYYLNGGIICATLYVIFNVLICHKLYSYREYRITYIISAAILALNIFCIFEIQYNSIVFILYALADNIDIIISNEKELQHSLGLLDA